jgi:EAL and modified HD-GYP domain-containing signal transduction protein
MAEPDPLQEFFIGRQPIIDRNHHLYAYELLFRSGRQKNSATVQDDISATANVILHAFADLGIENALGPYKGFINCDETLLLSDMLEALPSDKIVLEILETVDITAAIVERCRELKARGFIIALDDFVNHADRVNPLLDLVDIVKVDILPYDQNALREATLELRKWPVSMLAEKIEAPEQASFCHALGYALFQGYYFAKPLIIAGKKLKHSNMVLLKLLGLVIDEADVREMEAVLKHEPALAMNLLRLTNSAATGLRTRITSLRHAITLLGRRQLHRWLQLLMYSNPAGGTDNIANPLLQLASTRGRLMELLAAKLHPGDHEFEDHAFMSGIMSLIPTLMSTSMETILNSIKLSSDVQEALESRTGTLGTMLCLTEALENEDGKTCHDLTIKLGGINASTVNLCLTQALAWTCSISRENNFDKS